MDKFHDKTHKIIGTVSSNLDENIVYMDEIFQGCSDIVKRRFQNFYIIYTDGLANSQMIQDFIIRPFMQMGEEKQVIESADQKQVTTMEEVVVAILSGETIIFMDGLDYGIFVATKMLPTRGVQKAEEEVAMIGPQDSFNESLRTNTALIRRRIRDTRLKVESMSVGTRTKTSLALMYVEDLAKNEIVHQIKKQIEDFMVDGIFDSGMLEQFLEQDVMSPFPRYQLTQRPDKVSSGLLEGRIAVVVDNSPEVILLPVTLNLFFQASDDYYHRWEVATFARVLRYVAAFIAIGLPALYIAVVNYHPELLPTPFFLAILSARQGVPFPVVVEVLFMELAFELLREAGIRLPGKLGGTIGIVGGLIIGQAAVDAHVVSTIVVIVVAFTAIAAFSAPSESFAGAFRLLKFIMMLAAAIYGLYGFFLAFLGIGIHLFQLESYGIPYVYTDLYKSEDYVARMPWERMKYRPWFTKKGARVRQKSGGRHGK